MTAISTASKHPFLRARRILTTGGTTVTPANAAFCRVLGGFLVREPNLILVTGGLLHGTHHGHLPSADWSFVEGAREWLKKANRSEMEALETVLPGTDKPGLERFQAGNIITLHKKTPQARRFALVNSVDAVLTVAGGGGTRQQIELALALEKPVLPLPFTGGESRKAWQENLDLIQTLFGVGPDTVEAWQSTSLENVSRDALCMLAGSVKEHLMHQLKRRCFVIMPFSEAYLPLYQRAIRPAVLQAGLTPIRADHLDLIGNALKVLRDAIDSSECAVAVTTDWNPNVMYELGLVHAGGKPVVMLHELGQDGMLPTIPFDLSTEFFRGYRPSDFESLQRELSEILRSNIVR